MMKERKKEGKKERERESYHAVVKTSPLSLVFLLRAGTVH